MQCVGAVVSRLAAAAALIYGRQIFHFVFVERTACELLSLINEARGYLRCGFSVAAHAALYYARRLLFQNCPSPVSRLRDEISFGAVRKFSGGARRACSFELLANLVN
jgi:hypothetical protein